MRSVNMLMVLAAVLAHPDLAHADDPSAFGGGTSMQIQFAVPYGWSLSRQTGYPGLLSLLTRADLPEARILVSLDEGRQARGIEALVKENNRTMRALGFQVLKTGQTSLQGTKVWQTQARYGQGHAARELRQLYLLREPKGVLIVTASAPAKTLPTVLGDVELLLEALETTR